MISKDISTHDSRTSSPVAVNVWLLMEFSHLIFLSRLEFLKSVFWSLLFFWFSSMISQIPWKIFFIPLLMTPPSAVPSLIPLIGRQQPFHSLQTWIKSQAGETLGICLSILKKYPPIYFHNNPLEDVLSFKFWGLTICHDLSWESHISKLASKASR